MKKLIDIKQHSDSIFHCHVFLFLMHYLEEKVVFHMVNKFDEIKSFLTLTNHKWDFIFVSETWFTEEIEALFRMEQYQLFANSRTDKPGGGSAIYVLNDIEAK